MVDTADNDTFDLEIEYDFEGGLKSGIAAIATAFNRSIARGETTHAFKEQILLEAQGIFELAINQAFEDAGQNPVNEA